MVDGCSSVMMDTCMMRTLRVGLIWRTGTMALGHSWSLVNSTGFPPVRWIYLGHAPGCMVTGGLNGNQERIPRSTITDSLTDSIARESKNNGMFVTMTTLDPGNGELHPEHIRFIVPPTRHSFTNLPCPDNLGVRLATPQTFTQPRRNLNGQVIHCSSPRLGES